MISSRPVQCRNHLGPERCVVLYAQLSKYPLGRGQIGHVEFAGAVAVREPQGEEGGQQGDLKIIKVN